MHKNYIWMCNNFVYFGSTTVYLNNLGGVQKHVHVYLSAHYINKEVDKVKSITFG